VFGVPTFFSVKTPVLAKVASPDNTFVTQLDPSAISKFPDVAVVKPKVAPFIVDAFTVPDPEKVSEAPVPTVIVAVVFVPVATESKVGVPPVLSALQTQAVPLHFNTSPLAQVVKRERPVLFVIPPLALSCTADPDTLFAVEMVARFVSVIPAVPERFELVRPVMVLLPAAIVLLERLSALEAVIKP